MCHTSFNVILYLQTFILITYAVADLSNQTLRSTENATSSLPERRCTEDEFQCDSGQCIPKDLMCNGIPHCSDRSDETPKICGNVQCPEHTYKCAYGACVSGNSQCNGIRECFDGSDEICVGCPSIYNNTNMRVRCVYRNRELDNCVNPEEETIVELKCEEFYEFNTTSESETLRCKDGRWDQTIPHCRPVCGKKSVSAETLIINGKYVKKGDYPWQAALYSTNEKILFCGGSLITENIVLTAAHCVSKSSTSALIPKEAIIVAVGKYYRNFTDSRDVNLQYSAIKDIIVPLEYRGDVQNYLGDLALIVTENAFKLSKNVLPVCVDWKSNFKEEFSNPSSTGLVTGWGLTTETDRPSEILKELVIPYVDYKHCNLSFDFYQFLTHDKICAGYLNNGSSVCRGDSGGALVFPNTLDRRYYVVGVVSLSPRAPTEEGGCDSQTYGLYTRVENYATFMSVKAALHGVHKARCTLPDHPRNGYWLVKNSSVGAKYKSGVAVVNGTFIQIYCDRGFNLVGDNEIVCKNGVWSSGIGTCKAFLSTCILPQYPDDGYWKIYGFSKDLYTPGMPVNSGTVIHIFCKGHKAVKGPHDIFCFNGKWNAEIGTCVPATCPSLDENNKNIKITCFYKNTEIKNCTNPYDETVAQFRCDNFYEFSNRFESGIRYCTNGAWDKATPSCVPVCGLKYVEAEPLIVNGNKAKNNFYPWVVGLYKNKKFICGGSLITPRIVVTTAHCVTDIAEGTVKKNEIHEYDVAVGKYHRHFGNPLAEDAQFSKLEDIAVPIQYNGALQNFLGDLAVLKTANEFVLNKNVMPVCVNWNPNLEEEFSKSLDTTGVVTGWGYVNEHGPTAEVLQELFVPYVYRENCKKNIPEEFKRYLPFDKFCAGYLNGSSLCNGDSGSGLVFPNMTDHRYYLVGIVSSQSSNKRGGCDSHQYGVYTDFKRYTNYVQKQVLLIDT